MVEVFTWCKNGKMKSSIGRPTTPKKRINNRSQPQSGNGGNKKPTPGNTRSPRNQLHRSSPANTTEIETSHGEESRSDLITSRQSANGDRDRQRDSQPPTAPALGIEYVLKRIGNMENKISDLKKDNSVLIQKVSQLNNCVSGLNQKVSDLENDKSQLKNCVSDLKQDNDDLNQKVSNLENDKSQLKNCVSDLKQDNDDLNKKVSNLENDKSQLKNCVSDLNEQVSYLKQDNADLNITVSYLKHDLDYLRLITTQGEFVKMFEVNIIQNFKMKYDALRCFPFNSLRSLAIHLRDNWQQVLDSENSNFFGFKLTDIDVLCPPLQQFRDERNVANHTIYRGFKTDAKAGIIQYSLESSRIFHYYEDDEITRLANLLESITGCIPVTPPNSPEN